MNATCTPAEGKYKPVKPVLEGIKLPAPAEGMYKP